MVKRGRRNVLAGSYEIAGKVSPIVIHFMPVNTVVKVVEVDGDLVA